MALIRSVIYTNRSLFRFCFVILISLLLNGCAVIATAPVPLRIASNLHTGYSLYKNMDDNPDNDSWYMSYIKSVFGKEKEEVLFVFEDKDMVIEYYNNPAANIKL